MSSVKIEATTSFDAVQKQLSDATSSSPAGKKVVVFIGDTGTGKSTLLNSFMPKSADKAKAGSGARAVTVSTAQYDSVDPDILLVDTVGLNKPGSNLGIPLSLVEDRMVHFVVLLSNTRWQTEWETVLDKLTWAKLGQNISKWASHRFVGAMGDKFEDSAKDSAEPPPSFIHLQQAELSSLVFECNVHKPPPPTPVVKIAEIPAPVVAPPVRNISKLKPPHAFTKMELMFGPGTQELSGARKKLHGVFVTRDVHLCKQVPMKDADWRIISDAATVRQYRQTGEKLLEYYLHHMYDHANYAQNEHIMDKVVSSIDGLEKHIRSITIHENQQDEPSTETLVDYVEAMCDVLHSDRKYRKFIVHYLQTICEF